MYMAKGPSKGINTESRTDPAELPVDLQQLDRDRKGRFFRQGTKEPTSDKCFIGIQYVGNVAEFLTLQV